MAQQEMREHKQPSATSAFNALTVWGLRMKDTNRRAPDRAAIVERAAAEKQRLRTRVLDVARTVGLDGAVTAAAKRAAVPALAQSTYRVGENFDRFFSSKG
jgi:hypothetical protein